MLCVALLRHACFSAASYKMERHLGPEEARSQKKPQVPSSPPFLSRIAIFSSAVATMTALAWLSLARCTIAIVAPVQSAFSDLAAQAAGVPLVGCCSALGLS